MAVWQVQVLNFVYRGYSTLYTCAGLREKLRDILQSLGARGDLQLGSYNCEGGSSVARFQIKLASPIEATPRNVHALTTYDSRDELIARARGEVLPTAQDLPRFKAEWKTVSFARNRRMRLAPGDCDLVQQLRQQILPRMSVHVVNDDLRCSRAFVNYGAPRLTVAALVAIGAS